MRVYRPSLPTPLLWPRRSPILVNCRRRLAHRQAYVQQMWMTAMTWCTLAALVCLPYRSVVRQLQRRQQQRQLPQALALWTTPAVGVVPWWRRRCRPPGRRAWTVMDAYFILIIRHVPRPGSDQVQARAPAAGSSIIASSWIDAISPYGARSPTRIGSRCTRPSHQRPTPVPISSTVFHTALARLQLQLRLAPLALPAQPAQLFRPPRSIWPYIRRC